MPIKLIERRHLERDFMKKIEDGFLIEEDEPWEPS